MKIDNNVPMPAKDGRGVYRRSKWAKVLEGMASGDSFLATKKEYYAARMFAYISGIKIVTRKLKLNQYRIWKV